MTTQGSLESLEIFGLFVKKENNTIKPQVVGTSAKFHVAKGVANGLDVCFFLSFFAVGPFFTNLLVLCSYPPGVDPPPPIRRLRFAVV